MKLLKSVIALFILLISFNLYALDVVKSDPGYFPQTSIGRPVANGYFYVGIKDLDPEIPANQKQVTVRQESGAEVQIPQPVDLSAGGVPEYLGSPVTVLVDGVYSLKVFDSHDVQIYYIPESEVSISGLIGEDHNSDGSHIVYESIADLRASTLTPFDGQKVTTTGTLSAIDGFGGDWIWDAASTETDNTGAIVKVTSITTGRWNRLWNSEINAGWFGMVNDGATNSYTELDNAIVYAGTILETDGSYNRVTATVLIPAGDYVIASGSTIRLLDAVELKGAGRTVTTLTHGGGSVPLFDTDSGDTSNYAWSISDITLIGAGATSTYCVFANNSNRNNSIKRVNIRNFNVSLYFTDTWTFHIEDCDIYGSISNNIEWYNATDAYIVNSRIWNSGGHNLYINKSASFQTINLNLTNTYISQAQKAGVYLIDVLDANITGGSFESCNKEDADWGYIHQVTGAANVGDLLTVTNAYGTSTNSSASSRFLFASKGIISVTNTKVVSTGSGGGFFEYAIEVGTGIESLNISACDLTSVTKHVLLNSNTTPFHVASNEFVTITSSNSNLDVSYDIKSVLVDSTAGNVNLSGLSGGQKGQILHIEKTIAGNTLTIVHNAGAGDQNIFTNTLADVVVTNYGGVTLICTGASWFMQGL